MYYGKKKAIIITVIIIILVILLAAGGIFAYFFTDLFKSNQTLFYQYMGQALEPLNVQKTAQLKDIENLKQQKPYTIEGTLSVDYTAEEQNARTERLENVLPNLKASVTGKVDPLESLNNTNIKLEYGNVQLFNLDYAANDTVYGLKSDEVVTAYVGIRNENLKAFMQKLLGTQNKVNIADSIPPVDIYNLFALTSEEEQHIQDTYLPVLQQNISKEHYTKQTDLTIQKEGVDYVTTAYRLDLTNAEFYTVISRLLETLKQDSITLNLIATKAKAVGLGEDYTNVNQLGNTIDTWIKACEQKAQNNTESFSFVVYAYQGETVLTEVIVKNQVKMSVDYKKENDTEKLKLMIENLSTEDDYNQIQIDISQTSTALQSMKTIAINVDDETLMDITMNTNGVASQNNLKSNYEYTITQNGETTTISYEEETNFVDEVTDMIKIDNTNCAILNDYGTDQLTQLTTALIERIAYLLNQKIEMIGLTAYIQNPIEQQNTNPEGQNINQ